MASGIPSSLPQMSATARALCELKEKEGVTVARAIDEKPH
jgi:hypothetical protein